MFRQLRLLLVLVIIAVPVGADAQEKWDVAGFAALFGARSPEPEMRHYQQEWFRTGQGGVAIGRHFTPNLKVELEASRTGDGTQYIQRFITRPGVSHPFPIAAEAHKSVTSFAGTVTWQFFENQWVHPFVQAGLAADVDRRVVNTFPQQYFSGDPLKGGTLIAVADQTLEGPDATAALRGVIGGGVKMYVSPRLFVRTDGRAAFGRRGQHVSFRVGFGADF